ncbi:helix-turn-helix domain-containing protein [Haloplasma contractile]|uniref:DNA-binding protein n=1 Tax=Haloplasma contractile SSD-17B TaxID=1033810 RepID=F7PVG1_9MOLU|nr:helix-turn-helix transcriptional regulator [Haloplasma contractile]ERJ12872.1 Putative DNA-binding protein [Haloplasma contractile SSD-17B]
MLNTKKTGAYICKLRKTNDLTQLELAEKLHVSHQAISKWERGESMPDIQTLPKLAQIFKLTIDELLNGELLPHTEKNATYTEGKIIEHISSGEAGKVLELVQEKSNPLEKIVNIAPMIKTSEMDEIMANTEGIKFKVNDIIALAPFLSDDSLHKLVVTMINDSNDLDFSHITELVPFLSRETLRTLIDHINNQQIDSKVLLSLAPFLDEISLDKLANNILDQSLTGVSLAELAPFLSQATLAKLIDRINEESINVENSIALVPFLDQESVELLANKLLDKKIDGNTIAKLAPFLSRDALNKLANRIGKETNMDTDVFMQLAPFMGEDLLDHIVQTAMNRKNK